MGGEAEKKASCGARIIDEERFLNLLHKLFVAYLSPVVHRRILGFIGKEY